MAAHHSSGIVGMATFHCGAITRVKPSVTSVHQSSHCVYGRIHIQSHQISHVCLASYLLAAAPPVAETVACDTAATPVASWPSTAAASFLVDRLLVVARSLDLKPNICILVYTNCHMVTHHHIRFNHHGCLASYLWTAVTPAAWPPTAVASFLLTLSLD